MTKETVGFIGLGHMGGPMAGRLADAGYPLIAFDAAGTQERLPAGATAGASVEDVAARADTILLSLPNGSVSKTVCGQIARAANRRVQAVVDLSTIGSPAARDCARMLGEVGAAYVDAPVSGGVGGARAGTLALMVAAEPSVFERMKPLLSTIGKHLFHMGNEPGQGQTMKLLNNFLAATALAATSEALIFGAANGLDLAQMIEVLNASSGRNTATADKFPKSVVTGTYDYGFAAALMAKDVSLYLESVEATGVAHEIGATVAELWRRFSEACPGQDFTYIHKYLSEQYGS
ncbi:MAG: NAD(P)-dependent oxidoreductase [Chloroflexota bacterium]|nr:NAD(P)-dependent oxidoreductase [Chloroflexota bacterium]